MRRRLGLTVLAVTTMVAVAFAIPLALLVQSTARNRAIASADQEARSMAGVAASVTEPAQLQAILDQVNATSRHDVALVLPDGERLGADIELTAAQRRRAEDGSAFAVEAGGTRRVVTPMRSADGEMSIVLVSTDRAELRRGVTPAWATIGGLGILIVAIGLLLADRLVRSTVRAIEALGSVTRRLRAGEVDARVEVAGPSEVADVGRAVNELADRIDDLVAAEREAVADLSHRLRTPLTAVQLQAEAIEDPQQRAAVTDAVAALAADVDRVIRTARRTRPTRALTPVADLVTVVDRRLAFWRVLARQQARPLGWVRPEADGLWVPVPPEELEAAVDALLTNVFQHTPERSTCVVIVQPAGDGCRLTVEDGGDGIPDAALHRGRSGDGSTGLGLDIVRQTAERAGGRVRLGRSPAGGGRVTVSLPRAAAP